MLQAALVNAVISAVVTVMSWFVLHYLSRKREEYTRRRERSLSHLKEQIEELYGPLVGLIKQNRVINEVAVQKLPSTPEGLIDIRSFSEADPPIWEYFLEKHFLPLNQQMVELIRTKIHLLEAGKMPDSFRSFLSHAAFLECLYGLSKEKGVDSTSIQGEGWPLGFEGDAKSTLNDLVDRYNDHIRVLTGRESES